MIQNLKRCLTILFLLSTFNFQLSTALLAQQPTSTSALFEVNSHYVGGRTWADYKASAGAGLTLNIAAGTAICGNPPVVVTYAGGTLTMTNAATNYVYLDPVASCVPAKNTTGFTAGVIPLAQVVTAGGVITGVTDVRTWFAPLVCIANSMGSVTCGALAADQNFTVTTTGTGIIILNAAASDTPGQGTRFPGYGGLRVPATGSGALAIDYNSGAAWYLGLLLTTSGNIGIGKVPGVNAQLDVAKSIVSGMNTVTFSATPTFDASLGNTQKITLTGNVTSSTLSNATAGETINFIICQDATGSRTFVWPTNVKGGMTIGATLSKCSAQDFIFDGTNAYALSVGVTNM